MPAVFPHALGVRPTTVRRRLSESPAACVPDSLSGLTAARPVAESVPRRRETSLWTPSGVASRRMGSIWVESLGRNLDWALDLLADAVRDCTDELWETSMWVVPTPDANHELGGRDGTAVTEPMERSALVQRWSAPWCVAWHVLEVFDYDLSGDLAPWTPPTRFASKPHWRSWSSVPAWSRSEIVGYLDYCRRRALDTLADMTEEKAATPLPPSHRYRGQPHGWVITTLVGHTTEHASQIRQFITCSWRRRRHPVRRLSFGGGPPNDRPCATPGQNAPRSRISRHLGGGGSSGRGTGRRDGPPDRA